MTRRVAFSKWRAARVCFAVLCLAAAGAVRAEPRLYEIDPTHTFPSFSFSHMGISVWRGKFDATTGTLEVDRAGRTGTVSLQIDPASVNFGLDIMDAAAVGEKWFDVARFPEATYTGTLVFEGDDPVAVEGTLEWRGHRVSIPLEIRSFACIEHFVHKREVCGADATGSVLWSEFGLTKYGEGDADRVTFEIQVEAVMAAE